MSEGTFEPRPLDRDATTFIAGHRGLVGSAIWRKLEGEGFTSLVGRRSGELDLRDREAVFDFFAETRPRYVVLAAAKVGGILANNTYPVDFLSDNLRIQTNVMDAALEVRTARLLFLGSSCIYPRMAPQPIHEDSLLTGHLEPTNDAYAIAKIAGILGVQAVRRQYGLPWISAMPTNLYGPGDNFSPTGSHVLPALIRRYDEARASGAESVTNWGTGSPRREFLHVDDMAAACLHLMEHFDGPQQVNVGTGRDSTIKEIAETVASVVGFEGETHWDTSKPDGTPNVIFLQDELDRRFDKLATRVILPITDPYVVHHGSLGGFARVYCYDGATPYEVMRFTEGLSGVEAVYDKPSACAAFDLPPDREGDVVVISDAGTALGAAEAVHDLSLLGEHRLRSHGGISEKRVPFIISVPLNSEYDARAKSTTLRSYEIYDYVINGVENTPVI